MLDYLPNRGSATGHPHVVDAQRQYPTAVCDF
jgi:hypothetical protein